MVMVLVKSVACVFLLFLSALLSSNARLNPADVYHRQMMTTKGETGAEVNQISAIKASAPSTTNSIKVKNLGPIDGNSKELVNAKQVVRKIGIAKSSSIADQSNNRSLRSRFSDEVDGGSVAFSADYRAPRHHPPKNNK